MVEQNVNYITHNLPTHCPVYDGGNLQYTDHNFIKINNIHLEVLKIPFYSWNINNGNDITGLSTFSGLDTYRYSQEYIHDNTYNFNTSQHTRDGKCVPGVYYKDLSNPQYSDDSNNYLCKNIDNQVDCENEATVIYWGAGYLRTCL